MTSLAQLVDELPSDHQEAFLEVADYIKNVSDPSLDSNKVKLRLYALYKQATVGDCNVSGSWPGSVAFAKQQAWASVKGQTDAASQYIKLVVATLETNSDASQRLRTIIEKYTKSDGESVLHSVTDTTKDGTSSDAQMAPENNENRNMLNDKSVMEDDLNASTGQKKSTDEFVADQATTSCSTDQRSDEISDANLKACLAECAHYDFSINTEEALVKQIDNDSSSTTVSHIFTDHWAKRTLGIKPIIPRGQLDVSYIQLFRTLGNCIKGYCQLGSDESSTYASIQSLLTNKTCVTGLAVRSLLDLYLLASTYPPGSEIIMTPPINVPGMVQVLQHHQIRIVSVDIPDSDFVAVDVDAVERSITSRTKAILVVHPFGILSATDSDMNRLRDLCDKHNIHLLEDCAECYTGLNDAAENDKSSVTNYMGSPYSDLVFVSFGLIKTSTAIGGGVVLADAENKDMKKLLQDMSRIQQTFYAPQSGAVYFYKVFKALLLKIIADTPLLCGVLAQLCSVLSPTLYDKLVTCWLRGVPPSMQAIRQRPHPELARTMLKRIADGSTTTNFVHNRLTKAKKILESLSSSQNKSICVPTTHSELDHKFWLFPVLCDTADHLALYLRKFGVDATTGSSQLKCVDDSQSCLRAQRLMDRIVYLPISSPTFTNIRLEKLLKIMSLYKMDCPSATVEKFGQSRVMVQALLVGVLYLSPFYSFVLSAVKITIIGFIIAVCAMHWISNYIGKTYIQCSTAVSKHWDVIAAIDASRQPKTNLVDSFVNCELPRETSTTSNCVLLTGATGFVGSMLLYDLLKNRERLNLSKVYVLCRSKRGRCASERISVLLSKPMFASLHNNTLQSTVQMLEGDVTKPNLGLTKADIDLVTLHVTHVIHAAASVSFTQSLNNAARSNIVSSLNAQKLAGMCMDGNATYVHIGTAFVHGNMCGTAQDPLPQDLFSLYPYDPCLVLDSMLSTEYYASKVMRDLGFPNTYTFSKCVCEHLIAKGGTRSIIIRPSIVSPSLEYPHQGWGGDKPSTITAAACLYMSFPWNLWPFDDNKIASIPADVLSRFILNKVFCEHITQESDVSSDSDGMIHVNKPMDVASNDYNQTTIYNATCTFDKDSQWTWYRFAGAVLQSGVVSRQFGMGNAYIQLIFSKFMQHHPKLSLETYTTLHNLLIRLPIRVLSRIMTKFGFSDATLTQLSHYIDLPLLFFPYMRRSFHFQSEILVPHDFDSERYGAICVHTSKSLLDRHTPASEPLVPDNQFHSVVDIEPESILKSIPRTLLRPDTSFLTKVTALIIRKVLQSCFSGIYVDILSFNSILQSQMTNSRNKYRVVLLPTHRSYFDFIIISYMLFVFPELQIDLPYILAAEEFRNIAFMETLLNWLGVIFVRRAVGREDVNLKDQILHKEQGHSSSPCYEVFIEGTRSRDGRMNNAKTGAVRCFGSLKGSTVFVPITINYENIAELSSLSRETSGYSCTPMSFRSLVSWLKNVYTGSINLGKVHIVAGKPLQLTRNCKPTQLLREIQLRQVSNYRFTTFHAQAVAKVLSVPCKDVLIGLHKLGCVFLPQSSDVKPPELPNDLNEIWLLCLPLLQFLSPTIQPDNLKWALWLNSHLFSSNSYTKNGIECKSIHVLTTSLTRLLNSIDMEVDGAIKKVEMITTGSVHSSQVFQAIRDLSSTYPLVFLRVAVSFCKNEQEEDHTYATLSQRVHQSDSHLGKWGFDDTKFVMRVNCQGERYVVMTGDRYSFSGKELKHLVPFIEHETASRLALRPLQVLQTSERCSFKCALGDTEQKRISEAVPVFSVALSDRISHCGGQSQADVYDIRCMDIDRIPDAVVWPGEEAEVVKLVSLAQTSNWCLIPYGGGTNVTSATKCPAYEAEPRPIILVVMTKMNRIQCINEQDGLATIEAGIVGRDLVQELSKIGYTMGHEPDSIEFSTLGGWIATKASGMKKNKYGNIEDIVRSVRTVASDGVYDRKCAPGTAWGREATGYDPSSLIVGSEGCLGIITSAVVRIWPLPDVTDFDSILFRSFDTGLLFCRNVAKLGSNMPASCRMLDNAHFRLGRALRHDDEALFLALWKGVKSVIFEQALQLDRDSIVCATIRYEGTNEEVKNQKTAIKRLIRLYGGMSMGREVGRAGYDLTFVIAYLRDFAMDFGVIGESFETFSPWSKIETVITAVKEQISQDHRARLLPGKPFVGCRITQLYHEGACLYFYFCINMGGVTSPSDVFAEIEHNARKVILENGGSLSHHHGVGKLRSDFVKDVDSDAWLKTKRSIKSVIDPANVFGARNGPYHS